MTASGSMDQSELKLNPLPHDNTEDVLRLLQTFNTTAEEESKCTSSGKGANPSYLALFYTLGVIYMFLALAVVCDEFFVPALEVMSSEQHLNLSMDVAGATLMAAGGSAPELFTNFIGTFRESDIGIGTIVGSAVFNVLFVIGCCSILSKEVLTLTWWPLFRDCVYYAFGLVVLSVLVGILGEGEVVWYEALILLVMYGGYVVLMYYNRRLYTKLTGKELVLAGEEKGEEENVDHDDDCSGDNGIGANDGEDGKEGVSEDNVTAEMTGSGNTTVESAADISAATMENGNGENGENGETTTSKPAMDTNDVEANVTEVVATKSNCVASPRHVGRGDFRWPTTFRAGVLKLLLQPDSWIEKGGLGIVSKIQGDVDTVFKKIDADGSGAIDKAELRQLFSELGHEVDDDEFDQVFSTLDLDGNGTVSRFTWAFYPLTLLFANSPCNRCYQC